MSFLQFLKELETSFEALSKSHLTHPPLYAMFFTRSRSCPTGRSQRGITEEGSDRRKPIEVGPVSQAASRKAKRAAASQNAAAAQDTQPPDAHGTSEAACTRSWYWWHVCDLDHTHIYACALCAHRERVCTGHKALARSIVVHAQPADLTTGTVPPIDIFTYSQNPTGASGTSRHWHLPAL